MDSLTRIARAYNSVHGGSGRTMTGGVDARALEIPRKMFASARKIENGGSLTILATALVDTGSRMDELIFQEFKGTGNMELILDRKLSDRRLFPAIDIPKSGTRKEEKLFPAKNLEAIRKLRRTMVDLNPIEAMETLTAALKKHKTNDELLAKLDKVARRLSSATVNDQADSAPNPARLLERMLRIHQALRAGNFPNATTLRREIEVAAKTVHRDLEFMRDRLGLPIEYDAGRLGYYYTEEVGSFPSVQITEGELFALLVAEKALQQYRGTSFEKPLFSAHQQDGAIAAGHHFPQPGRPGADHLLPHARRADPGLGDFRRARQGRRPPPATRTEYRKPGQPRAEQRAVDPYHLANINGEWFLFAYDHRRKDIRTFAPARIKSARPTGQTFERPQSSRWKSGCGTALASIPARGSSRWSSASRAGGRLRPREKMARLATAARTEGRRGGIDLSLRAWWRSSAGC